MLLAELSSHLESKLEICGCRLCHGLECWEHLLGLRCSVVQDLQDDWVQEGQDAGQDEVIGDCGVAGCWHGGRGAREAMCRAILVDGCCGVPWGHCQGHILGLWATH